jgi:hypothetical protein
LSHIEDDSSALLNHNKKAPPRFEIGLLDSKFNVVTTRLRGQFDVQLGRDNISRIHLSSMMGD